MGAYAVYCGSTVPFAFCTGALEVILPLLKSDFSTGEDMGKCNANNNKC